MPKSPADIFLKESNEKAFDLHHRQVMSDNIAQYRLSFEKSTVKFLNLPNSKKKANLLKWRVMENLDRYLIEFESNFKKKAGQVIWANDAAEAHEAIANIIEQQQAKRCLKSKSSTLEEIELSQFLSDKSIEVTETDLGDYIAQLRGDRSSHMTSSIMHLNKDEVAKILQENSESIHDTSTEALANQVRESLRNTFTQADISITGANFLIAETGSVVLSENEGNMRLSSTFPKTHIVVVGIEKILPNLTDLDLFLPLLASHGTGKQLTTYNSILNGPKQLHETDGPQHMYVILLDNGRSTLLAQKEQRQGLYCIRCGACLQACPTYQNIGGHSYQTTYQGPIGALITPHLKGMKTYKHLSFASTLSNQPNEACPVHIDIQKMLLLNRRDSIQQGLTPASETRIWHWFTKLMKKRGWLDFFGSGIKSFILRYFFKKSWGQHRELPKLPKKSFAEQWQEEQKKK